MDLRLALEIGGTKFQAAVGTPDGKIIASGRCRVSGRDLDEQLAALTGLARQVAAGHACRSVGIGFGGPVDLSTGRVVLSHHVAGWSDFPLADWAGETFGLPAAIENDTNAGALAEATCGAGRGCRTVFYTNVGSGIGGGLVIDGRIYNGRFGACEIGHTRLWDARAGEYCIVEHLCSGWSIDRMARERAAAGDMPRALALAAVTAEHVGRAAGEGDGPARELIAEAATNFGVAVANVVTLLNPERVVVGGGVSLIGEAFFAPLRASAARHVIDIYRDNYRIVPAELGENVVLVGALLI